MITSQNLAADLDVSYRQLNYWMTKGYAPPSHYAQGGGTVSPRRLTPGIANPGSGRQVLFDDDAAKVAEVFASLVHAGFDHVTAHYIRQRLDGETPMNRQRDAALADALTLVVVAIQAAAQAVAA